MPCFTWSEIRRQQTWLEKIKIYKQTNKRENKHIKKKTTSKKLWWLLFLIFSTKFKRITEHQPCDVDNYEKNYLLFHIPRFFQNWLTHEKKIPLLLTHSFLIIIPLLQRNDAYWIMYLKKRKKKHKRTTATIPKKLKQSIGDSLSAYYKIITHTLTASFFHQVLTYRYITSTYYVNTKTS